MYTMTAYTSKSTSSSLTVLANKISSFPTRITVLKAAPIEAKETFRTSGQYVPSEDDKETREIFFNEEFFALSLALEHFQAFRYKGGRPE